MKHTYYTLEDALDFEFDRFFDSLAAKRGEKTETADQSDAELPGQTFLFQTEDDDFPF